LPPARFRGKKRKMDSFDADAVVVGAGAVGLAVARRLALDGHDTLILEKNDHPGMETSARNSEVIHAGIYYPQASLKATLCLAGKHLLYDFCASHGVPHKRLGKLIVGRAGQEAQLDSIARLAAGNGVDDLRPLNRRQIAELEPDVVAEMGLFSLSTGIIDSHQYMLALLGDRTLVRSARVATARPKEGGWLLSVQSGGEELALKTRLLVNAAGLWAQSLAAHIEGLGELPPLFLAKGNYAGLSRKSPFRHLVYPIPEPGGLGIHVTLDMAGRARFGPNVEWLASNDPAGIDYAVSPDIAARFAPVIASYWPGVHADMLSPDYAGVRPKLSGPGEPSADFRIDGPQVHGLPGLVNLFGIESPGLTASLAIADHVAGLLG
jgi:L-2-hydroxyglutarate oxidase LhgO